MGIRYEKGVVLSIGTGCQTALQIEEHKSHLDRLMGELGRIESTPFDWLILPPHAATNMLTSGELFPETLDELEYLGKRRRFYWPRHDMWFWHMVKGRALFEDHKSKFAFMRERIEGYRDLEVLAMWSNTQANLTQVPLVHDLDLTARGSVLRGLEAALKSFFPKSSLFAVVRQDRHDTSDPVPLTMSTTYRGDDAPKDWRGTSAAWTPALTDAVIRTGFAARAGAGSGHVRQAS